MKTLKLHTQEIKSIAAQIKAYAKSNHTKKLRFFHGDSNSTRADQKENYFWINISSLDSVIEVNASEGFVLIEPNVPMDALVNETLKFGMIPRVVMEFPGITVGGGINGAALESSSFKYGQFNDNCIDYEIILGNGEIVTANEKQNADLFYGISSSYGSLGLLTLIKLKLIPSHTFVQTTFYPLKGYEQTLSFLKKQTINADNDFLEGIIYDKNNAVVITGKLVDDGNDKIQHYSKAENPWFYERAKKITAQNKPITELVPIVDYLFRYNRGGFWVGEYAFPYIHVPNNKLTKYLFNPVMNTRKLHDAMTAINHSQTFFVQDFYAPYAKSLDLLKYSEKKLGIFPIWLCPIKSTQKGQKLSPHYISDPMLMDIGIWGRTDSFLEDPIQVNKDYETFSVKNNIRKMFYAHVYFNEDAFWKVYDRKWYDNLRKKYHAEKTFPTIWQKVFVSETYKLTKWKGALKLLKETFIERKHLNT